VDNQHPIYSLSAKLALLGKAATKEKACRRLEGNPAKGLKRRVSDEYNTVIIMLALFMNED
jgi:hypothetical protein